MIFWWSSRMVVRFYRLVLHLSAEYSVSEYSNSVRNVFDLCHNWLTNTVSGPHWEVIRKIDWNTLKSDATRRSSRCLITLFMINLSRLACRWNLAFFILESKVDQFLHLDKFFIDFLKIKFCLVCISFGWNLYKFFACEMLAFF